MLFPVIVLMQLLKAIFGTNLAGQWESHVAAIALRPPVSRGTARSSVAGRPGIYNVCLNQPYIQLTQAMANTTMKINAPQSSGTAGPAPSVEHDDSTRLVFPCQQVESHDYLRRGGYVLPAVSLFFCLVAILH